APTSKSRPRTFTKHRAKGFPGTCCLSTGKALRPVLKNNGLGEASQANVNRGGTPQQVSLGNRLPLFVPHGAPEGRQSIARGVSPWDRDHPAIGAPEGRQPVAPPGLN